MGRNFWILCGLGLSMLMSSLGTSIANVALPTLAKTFAASFQEVQWVVIAYLLSITIMIVSAGRLGDLFGRRLVLLAGIILFTVASIFCGIAPTLLLLISARAIQGLGAAILMALSIALVRQTVAKEKIGSAMGLLGTMSAVGTMLGPSLGGFLISGFGWHSIFLLMALIGIVNFYLAFRYLPKSKNKVNESQGRFDRLGTLLLGLTLAGYALTMTVGHGHLDKNNISLLILSCITGGLFLITEAKVASPLIQLSVFRNMNLTTSLIVNAIVSTVMMSTLVIGPFYLSRVLNLNEALVGLAMSVGPVMSMISGVPAGRIVDRFGAKSIVTIGLIQMLIGVLSLAILPTMFGIAGYIVAVMLLSPGYQLFQASNSTLVMMGVNPDQQGVISGMLSLSRNLGLITGASVMGALFTFGAATNDMTTAQPEAVLSGMRLTFMVAGGLVIVALTMTTGSRAKIFNRAII